MNILDNNSSELEGEEQPSKRRLALEVSDGSSDETFRVNERFALRFEKQKRAQELQAAKHLDLGSDDGEAGSQSSTDSETEDEDAEMLTPALDLKIMKTINKIRRKDPDIYDTGKGWFSDRGEKESDDNEDKGEDPRPSRRNAKDKPMRYKDVVREQILQARTAEDAISSDEDEEGGGDEGGRKELAYDEEQEKLRKGFLGSVAEQEKDAGSADGEGSDEEGDGLLKVRQKTAAELAEEEALLQEEVAKMASQGDGGEEDDFLKDFVANRRWLDPHSNKTPSYDEILNAPRVQDSEDEQDVDRADEFESKYNLRFEEDGGREITMHSRNVPGSMRRKDDRRKRERESRKARKAEERQRKEAELRRLKNIKREEIRKRLEDIQAMSGGALFEDGSNAGEGTEVESEARALLEGDFDSQRWDSVTERAFGDGYYEAEDADDGWKPGDDPLEGLGDLDRYTKQPEPDGVGADGSGNLDAVKEEIDDDGEEGQEVGEDEEEEEYYEELDGEEEADGAGEVFGTLGAQKEKLLGELYKLDYEDIIGDIPCRFKYTKVRPSDFGLSPGEILLADDKELNKYVPLKKLAPYRADEPKLDARHRRRLREEIKEREKAANEEMMALRAKKKRRGKRKAASSSPAPAPSPDVEATDAATPQRTSDHCVDPGDVTVKLAGGKRRRRKKGQKKQRARKGGGGGGEDSDDVGGTQNVSDMVPRVRPMTLPSTGAESNSGGLDPGNGGGGGASEADVSGDSDTKYNNDANDTKSKGKKKRRKRGRSSNEVAREAEGDESRVGARAGAMHSALDGGTSVAADRSGTDPAEKSSVKKVRRGSGEHASGDTRGSFPKKRGFVDRSALKPSKKINATKAKLAKTTGVSKSRLASYGL